MAKSRRTMEPVSPSRFTFTNESLWPNVTPANAELVNVVWRDIKAVSNWNEDEEVAPVRFFHTVGYLLYEGPDPKDPEEDITIIANTWDGDELRWRDYIAFPSPVVREIQKLTSKRKRKKS